MASQMKPALRTVWLLGLVLSLIGWSAVGWHAGVSGQSWRLTERPNQTAPQINAPATGFTNTVTSLTDSASATANDGTLRGAILAANQSSSFASIGFNISGGGTITLAKMLPILTNANGISINGTNGGLGTITVSGNNASRIFFIGITSDQSAAAGSTLTVTPSNAAFSISSLTLTGGRAAGGDGGRISANTGGTTGGGGAGLGGAIFLNAGTLSISNVTFTNNSAVGGNGGNQFASGGNTRSSGGGGMGGRGGDAFGTGSFTGGGGGFLGRGGDTTGAGVAGEFTGGTGRDGAAGGTVSNSGGATGGGGAGGSGGVGGAGGGVGGSGGSTGGAGKAGGFGGGGGGGNATTGGSGGYGGGGGGGSSGGGGGAGGFGGGGGGGPVANGSGGFGGGNGASGLGSGGAGLGGAIFVRQGATLNITDGSFSGGTVTGGTGGANSSGTILGNAGQGIGQALFLAGGATYTVSSGTVTLSDSIGGGTNALITGGFTKAGAGTLTLSGANTYTGTTTVSAGTLSLSDSGSFANSATISIASGATLNVSGVTGGANFSNSKFSLASGQTLGGNGSVTGGVDVRSGAFIAPGTSPGQLTVNGDVSFNSGSTFNVEINGTTAGSGYDQLIVSGAVSLGSATLSLSGTHTPVANQTFTILNNTGSGAITGTFNGLAEGATISNFLGSTLKAKISYTGGTGNDVVLTVLSPSAVCDATLSPTSASIPASGGPGDVLVQNLATCPWTATSTVDWITITAGSSGVGIGVTSFSVAPNSAPNSRTGTLMIGGRSFTVIQAGTCNFALSPATAQTFTFLGGSGHLAVSSASGCQWTARSSTAFVSLSPGGGAGNGGIDFIVAPNPDATRRTATISVGGLSLTILQAAKFVDVPPSHPFFAEISQLSARGITSGCGAGSYCPDSSVTREQMAIFITRSLGEFNPSPPTSQRFLDVPPSRGSYAFIDEFAQRGITAGCGGGNFCPDVEVTRGPMAAFIVRAKGIFNPDYNVPQRFNDVPTTNAFYGFIEQMWVLGITKGCGGGNYCPEALVKRGEMAAFLVRAFGL